MTVEGEHVYRVSALGALVHNNVCGVPKGGVYVLRDRATNEVVRSGHAKNLHTRRLQHLRDPDLMGYQFEPVHRVDDNATRRGLEMELDFQYSPRLNYNRPIDPNNANLRDYLRAANDFLDALGN
jgi:hypothetical protein